MTQYQINETETITDNLVKYLDVDPEALLL